MDLLNFDDKHYFLDKRTTIKYEEMAQMASVTQRIISLNNEFIQTASLKAELLDDQMETKKHPAYSPNFIKKASNWHLYMNNISKLSF